MIAKVIAVAVALLISLVIGMNGFSERQADPVFIGFFAMTVVVVIVSGALSGRGSKRLAERMRRPMLGAGALSVSMMSVAGGPALVAGCFIVLIVGSGLPR